MERATKAVRKIIVALIGFPLLVLGIVLIPLPGPGLLICVLAFFILSIEFEWANRYFDKLRGQLRKVINDAKKKQKPYK